MGYAVGNYLKEILFRPAIAAWLFIAGLISVITYLRIAQEFPVFVKLLFLVSVFLLCLLIHMVYVGFQIYNRTLDPVKLRQVCEGRLYFEGKILVILDKASWIRQDQILTLFSMNEEIPTPVCLLRVETFTTEHYPQCVILKSLTRNNLEDYLVDKARWNSLKAKVEFLGEYIPWLNQQ